MYTYTFISFFLTLTSIAADAARLRLKKYKFSCSLNFMQVLTEYIIEKKSNLYYCYTTCWCLCTLCYN